jgi:predicted RNA-binding Zn-ribbon protein involved in translation (DUF1610 family)
MRKYMNLLTEAAKNTEITKCPNCGSLEIWIYDKGLELNSFRKLNKDEDYADQPSEGPNNLYWCQNCGFVWNDGFEPMRFKPISKFLDFAQKLSFKKEED